MQKRIDPKSYFWTIVAFFVTWALFAWEAGSIGGTFFAALLTAALFWVSYTLIRWLILAVK